VEPHGSQKDNEKNPIQIVIGSGSVGRLLAQGKNPAFLFSFFLC
jgi:hypothetical protein